MQNETVARRYAIAVFGLAKERAEASNETAAIATDYAGNAQAIVEQAHKTVAAELEAARANEDATVRELAAMMVERVFANEVK